MKLIAVNEVDRRAGGSTIKRQDQKPERKRTMKTELLRWGTAALVILGLMIGTAGLTGAEELDGRGGPRSGWASGTAPYAQAVQPLDRAEAEALNRAIVEEYGALNTYKAAIAQLGSVYPFSQIVRAEQQHIPWPW
jgi:hypothetical protein